MKKKTKMVKCHGKFCPKCLRVLFSFYRHHYVECSCKHPVDTCMVDGGFDYNRGSVSGENITVGFPAKMLDEAGIKYPEDRVYYV